MFYIYIQLTKASLWSEAVSARHALIATSTHNVGFTFTLAANWFTYVAVGTCLVAQALLRSIIDGCSQAEVELIADFRWLDIRHKLHHAVTATIPLKLASQLITATRWVIKYYRDVMATRHQGNLSQMTRSVTSIAN